MGSNKNPDVARWYASAAHNRVGKKYGNQPYTYHLQQAVEQLYEHVLVLPVLRCHDHDFIVCATWLHDVIEDTGTTADELGRLFCDQVVELVEAVTDGPGKNRKEKKAHVYVNIRAQGPAALAVKLADRLANSLACGLAKDPDASMLSMYRKEQYVFEQELWVMAVGTGFGPVFQQIRKNLGMEEAK